MTEEKTTPPPRPKFDLSSATKTYPNVFYLKKNKYVLVQGEDHYLLTQARLDKLVRQCAGHTDEIARHFKPRSPRKPRDPNAPKKKRVKVKRTAVKGDDVLRLTGTGGWLDPDIRDKDDPIFAPDGFMYRHVMIEQLIDRAKKEKKTVDPALLEEYLNDPQVPDEKKKGIIPPEEKKAEKKASGHKKAVKKKATHKPTKKKATKKATRKRAKKKATLPV